MRNRRVWFGAGLGDWSGADVATTEEVLRLVAQADRDGLDLFSVADHPYFGKRLDAYATVGFGLGRTERISGVVTVTNPARPVILLARTVSSLAALSGGRVVLGIGTGGSWDAIASLGVTRLTRPWRPRLAAGTTPDGRIFQTARGGITQDPAYSTVLG